MSKKITIKGVAVKEQVSRNKRKYIASELEKFTPTLIGRPILKDHESYTDNVIGKVTEAIYNPETTEVNYIGWIKDDSVAEKIRDGRITEVSIGAIAGKVVKEKKDDDVLIPIDMEALELSTTPTPGNKGTSISFEKQFTKEEVKKIIQSYSPENISDNNNINERRMNMKAKEHTENTVESVIDNSAELESLKAEIEKLKATNESLNKKIREDAISKYNELCEAKGVKSKDLSEATMEMINFAIETVEELPEPVAEDETKEEPAEEPSEDKTEETPAEEEKPEAEFESEEVETEDETESEESLKGYTITMEDCSKGFAFYKSY